MFLHRLLTIAALTLITAVAHATTFTVTAIGAGVNLNVTLVGSAEAGNANAFDLTSALGTFNGSGVNLHTPGASSGQYNITTPDASGNYFTYNNVLYTKGDLFDGFGLLLNIASGSNSKYANFFIDSTLAGAPYVYLSSPDPSVPEVPVTLTLTQSPTPEPSSFLLLGTGLAGAYMSMRRRLA